MSKWTDMGNNAIAGTFEQKVLGWNNNQKHAYRRMAAKRWARAIKKIPNFKSMNPDQINAWHEAEAAAGMKIREQEAHSKDKTKAAKKTRSRRSA